MEIEPTHSSLLSRYIKISQRCLSLDGRFWRAQLTVGHARTSESAPRVSSDSNVEGTLGMRATLRLRLMKAQWLVHGGELVTGLLSRYVIACPVVVFSSTFSKV